MSDIEDAFDLFTAQDAEQYRLPVRATQKQKVFTTVVAFGPHRFSRTPEEDEPILRSVSLLCPPSDAPSNVSLNVSFTGLVNAGDACETAISFESTTPQALSGWTNTVSEHIGNVMPCGIINVCYSTGEEVVYTCPGGCDAAPTEPRTVEYLCDIWKAGSHWFLNVVLNAQGEYCELHNDVGGTGELVDIGTNPIGVHVITYSDAVVDITWTATIT